MILDSGARREFETGAVREAWNPVVEYEGLYEISDCGRVKSLYNDTKIKRKDGIMSLKLDDKGYFRINLYKNKKSKTFLVNRLVALSFIPNPDNLPYVGHDDDNKQNNNVKNLYWTNASENLMHNGLHLKIAKKRNISKVVEALSIKIVATSLKSKEQKLHFPSMQEAQRNGFNSGKISLCISGKRKSHMGYLWEREVV